MRSLLPALLLAATTLPALAGPWSAPDSTRPAPWGGAARAPQVLIPWATPSGGPATMDPITGDVSWTDPASFSDPSSSWDGGGSADHSWGGGEGSDNGGASNSESSNSSSASCGGPNSSSNSCGPSSDF